MKKSLFKNDKIQTCSIIFYFIRVKSALHKFILGKKKKKFLKAFIQETKKITIRKGLKKKRTIKINKSKIQFSDYFLKNKITFKTILK